MARRQGTRSQARLDRPQKEEGVSDHGSILRRINWSKLLALLLLLANALFMYQFLTSSRFWVREVEVKGGELVSGDEVKDVLGAPDRSIFRVNAWKLENRIQRRFGCVKNSSVHCKLPCTMIVTLEERQDVLVWVSEENHWWVDKDGNVLGPTTDPQDRVVIRDVQGYTPSPGEHLVGVPFDLAWDVAGAVPAVKSYDYVPNVGLVLHVTDHRWPVYLGYEGDAAFKVAVMRKLVQRLLEKGMQVEYIDLRNERRPSYGEL
ncbi:MAG: cell division protein FtsQ/DivIB [Anaerolineales bacterium]